MADENNVILDYDEVANLDNEKLEKAKKRFQDTAYTLMRDVTPGVGEIQSYKYALEDASAIGKAARGEPGYKDMTPLEALGYVGLTGLGIAGMTPIVGPYFRRAAQGIRALMPKRARPSDPLNRNVREAVMNDPTFRTFVEGLPEYRRGPESRNDNIREFLFLSDARRNELIDQTVGAQRAITGSVKQTPLMTEQSVKKIEGDFEASKIKNNKSLVVQAEPLSFGKTKRQSQANARSVQSFIGSPAWDYVKAKGNEFATPKEWMGFMKGSLSKGVKAEELDDAGLILFDDKRNPIGGDLFKLNKSDPKLKIPKSDVLAVLETNPTYKLQVKNYSYPITKEDLDKTKNFELFAKDGERIITNVILDTPVAQRNALRRLVKDIEQDLNSLNSINQKYSASVKQVNGLTSTKQELINLQASGKLSTNDRLIINNLVKEYDTLSDVASKGLLKTNLPRHKMSFNDGGFNYQEKVIYLDESIPGNESAKKVYSSHFNDPNPIAHARYDQRGVDTYGDTFYIGEIQSDPHQSIAKKLSKYEGNEPLIRNNPFGNKIFNNKTKREIQGKIDAINDLTKKANERPLSPPEFDELKKLQKERKILEKNFQVRPSLIDAREYQMTYRDSPGKTYDYFPLGKESTWVKATLKGVIDDAQKQGVRYVAIGGADNYNFSAAGFKKKIEQFYGLSGDALGTYRKVPGSSKRLVDGKNIGKYRNWDTGEIEGTAVIPKAMQDIAKEIGAKVVVRKVMKTDITKPYKVTDADGKIVDSFKTKADRDQFLKTDTDNFYKPLDLDDPSNYNVSVVLDLAGSKKGKMKAYKLGGLVQVKREYFAPLF